MPATWSLVFINFWHFITLWSHKAAPFCKNIRITRQFLGRAKINIANSPNLLFWVQTGLYKPTASVRVIIIIKLPQQNKIESCTSTMGATLFTEGKVKERCIFCIQEQASIIKFWRDSECFAKKFTIRLRIFLPERVDTLLTSVWTMPNDTHLGKISSKIQPQIN